MKSFLIALISMLIAALPAFAQSNSSTKTYSKKVEKQEKITTPDNGTTSTYEKMTTKKTSPQSQDESASQGTGSSQKMDEGTGAGSNDDSIDTDSSYDEEEE